MFGIDQSGKKILWQIDYTESSGGLKLDRGKRKETEVLVGNTVFDDVFRTIVERIPQLAIPLINEVFCTDYPE
ncbi:hypothetical protein D7V96_26870, partial [bacterium D16-59]